MEAALLLYVVGAFYIEPVMTSGLSIALSRVMLSSTKLVAACCELPMHECVTPVIITLLTNGNTGIHTSHTKLAAQRPGICVIVMAVRRLRYRGVSAKKSTWVNPEVRMTYLPKNIREGCERRFLRSRRVVLKAKRVTSTVQVLVLRLASVLAMLTHAEYRGTDRHICL